MHELIKRIEYFIGQHQLIGAGQTVIVGLSGGPDSVFLLHAMHQLLPILNIKLVAAHLDHGWRITSSHDVAFCKALCKKLGIEFISAHASEFAHIKKNGSQEEYGRQLRRAFFNRVTQQINDRDAVEPLIALAHHQDDQVETFFIRLIRGTGLQGLACMKPRHGNYIRPLLCVSKAEIVEFLTQHDINYLLDETNTSDVYLRNRIRSSVIPSLVAADKRFVASCLKSVEHLAEADDFIETLTAQALKEVRASPLMAHRIQQDFTGHGEATSRKSSPPMVFAKKLVRHSFSDGGYRTMPRETKTSQKALCDVTHSIQPSSVVPENVTALDLKKFKVQHPFIQRRVLMSWLIQHKVTFTPTAAFLDELMRFILSDRGGKHRVHEGWSLVKKQQRVWIEK